MPRPLPIVCVCAALLAGCAEVGGGRTEGAPLAAARRAETAAIDPPAAPAATATLPAPLSLAACIAWAIEHNRDLRAQISADERARLETIAARSALYAPRLTASGQRQISSDTGGTDTVDTATGRIALDTNVLGFAVAPYAEADWSRTRGVYEDTPYATTVGLAISRRIFALAEDARLSARVNAAERARARSVNSLALRVRRLALDAARAFLDLQRAETRIRLREIRLEQARAFLAGVREAVVAGLKAPIEESNAAIDANQAEANLLADRQAVDNARDRLLSLLDHPLGGALPITAEDVTGVQPDLPPLADDLARTLQRHEDLLNLHLDAEQAREDTAIARDRLAPQITATAGAARTWESARLGEDGPDEPADVVTLGVAIDLPLDAWTGERAQVLQRQRAERELRLRERSLAADLERQVRELRRRIESQQRGVDLAEQRLAAERAKYAATEASYRTGRVDNLELTRAREALDRAEVDLVEARIDLVLALAEREALLPPAAIP